MSITDELREWAKTLTRWWYDPVKDEYTYTTGTMPPSIDAIRLDSNIIAIAARIDAEHQKAIRELNNLADASVLLPVDADGVPIRVGDKVYQVEGGWVYTVKSITFYPENTTVSFECKHGFGCDNAHSLRHYHAPTVEDVLREFGIDWEHESDCEDRAALLKEYASKLRLAEGEDA